VPSGRSIQKPYQNGEAEAYQMDILNRYMKGEFDSKDSIKLIDSLQYETVSGRTVYGGGGIMPDYFVPLDTSGVTAWYTQVMNKGLLTKYTFQFVNQYRDSLEQLKTPNQLSDWLEDHNIVEDFVRYAQRQNVRGRTYFISASFPLVLTQIKAGIARLILGDDAYWKLLQEQDPTLNKAVEVVVSADSAIHLN
jgi:carboxyl-terminal processing protease